ncbi:MAG TPA: class I SAM-dependent methyltransferase [Pseudonocardiaceae bacterium]|nr:class I SAM-dependent methyltransferase [Pseudonocardiaceae bacterium]
MTRVSPDWLALRESADAAARSAELVDQLRAYLVRTTPGPLVIRDLGCGTGSMGRWLAGRLPGPQHWILHDRDADLLAIAVDSLPRKAADGSPVTAEARVGDLTTLTAGDLADTSLVVASALLDLLTGDEVDGLAGACVDAGCPALLLLSVVGLVGVTPADPLDAEITTAFNAHQRRFINGRWLLGPDAVKVTTKAFERRGVTTAVRPSPWRLAAEQGELTMEWLRGWVSAAAEQWPDFAGQSEAYLRRRLDMCLAGELRVMVQHQDLLALPAPTGGDPA